MSSSAGKTVGLAVAAFVSGFAMPIQTALNAKLAFKCVHVACTLASRPIIHHPRLSGQRMRATFISFIVAMVTVLIAAAGVGINDAVHHKDVLDFSGTSWWMYLGGIIGCTHVYGGVCPVWCFSLCSNEQQGSSLRPLLASPVYTCALWQGESYMCRRNACVSRHWQADDVLDSS